MDGTRLSHDILQGPVSQWMDVMKLVYSEQIEPPAGHVEYLPAPVNTSHRNGMYVTQVRCA